MIVSFFLMLVLWCFSHLLSDILRVNLSFLPFVTFRCLSSNSYLKVFNTEIFRGVNENLRSEKGVQVNFGVNKLF